MKKMLIVFLLLLGCSLHQLGVEEVSLTNRINFEEKMSKNEVFLKRCTAFDLNYAANRVYFVDKNYGHILVVELSSGKLVKTISSKGQGPAELHEPTSMRIRDGKIFVLDRGFGGIKMFDTEGRNLGQFRLKTIPWRWTRIDVNDKGEIFVGSLDRNDKSMVSVYDSKGTFLRALIKYKGTDLAKASRKKSGIQYFFKLDNDGNIVLLFYMLRQMAKYDAEGNQLWSVEIKNRILDEYPPELDKYNSNGKIYKSTKHIFDMDVNEANEIIVGHAGGGCIFTPGGALTKLLLVPAPYENKMYNINLNLFRTNKGLLMTHVPLGVYLYSFK